MFHRLSTPTVRRCHLPIAIFSPFADISILREPIDRTFVQCQSIAYRGAPFPGAWWFCNFRSAAQLLEVYIFLIRITNQVDLNRSVCPYERYDLGNYKSCNTINDRELGFKFKFRSLVRSSSFLRKYAMPTVTPASRPSFTGYASSSSVTGSSD